VTACPLLPYDQHNFGVRLRLLVHREREGVRLAGFFHRHVTARVKRLEVQAILTVHHKWDKRCKHVECFPGSRHVVPSEPTALVTFGADAIAGNSSICPRKTVLVHNAALYRTSEQSDPSAETPQKTSYAGRKDTI
jgi:hypothetical protein